MSSASTTQPSRGIPAARDPGATFVEVLEARGLRVTGQRRAIFEAAIAHEGHFTAEELLEAARRRDRSVSRATVYRTLPILIEGRLVKAVDVGRDTMVYLAHKGVRTEQAQIVCLDCQRIHEIDAPFLEWYGRTAAEKVGLVPESLRLQVYARCPRSRSAAGCEHQPRAHAP